MKKELGTSSDKPLLGSVQLAGAEQGAGHTPGPWRVAPSHHYSPTSLHIDAGPNGLSSYICEVGQRGDKRAEADARLIAAAPDLLAQLKSAEGWLSEMHSETDEGERRELREVHSAAWECIDKMRAAIAKATGVHS